MQQDLCVGMSTKTMSFRFQISTEFWEIINLTIEDERHLAIGTRHRLMAKRREIKN